MCAGSSDESGVAPHGAADVEAVSGVPPANYCSASAVGGVSNGDVGQPAPAAPTFDGGELPIRVSPTEAGASRFAAREKRFAGRKTVTIHPTSKDRGSILKAYPEDVRERVLRAVDQGRPRAEIVQLFSVSLATLKRYRKQRRDEGHVKPKAIPGRLPKKRAQLPAGLHSCIPTTTLHWSRIVRCGNRPMASRSVVGL
jgi:hypothetical protein